MSDKRANRAQINDWLAVGNCESCPDAEEPVVIHISRDDHPDQERHCIYNDRYNLRMNYYDGAIIDPSNMSNLNKVIEKLQRRKEPTLVHCHAGMCRSPTIAILLLVAVDGMHPFDAHALVTKQIFEQRSGELCNVVYEPFRQIVRIWQGRD